MAPFDIDRLYKTERGESFAGVERTKKIRKECVCVEREGERESARERERRVCVCVCGGGVIRVRGVNRCPIVG